MEKKYLRPETDPMGAAIRDYYRTGKASRLRVFSPDFDEDEIPVDTLFRTYAEMSDLEKMALETAKGKILDVGAGSGCHCLALKEMGKEAEAIDISEISVEIMKERGIDAKVADLFDPGFIGGYDTILMLMNGSGIIGKLDNMTEFFTRIKCLLKPGGILLMDSSDLKYLFEDEDGSMMIELTGNYYGELEYSMKYKNIKGAPFPWLYIDFDTLSYYAEMHGFKAEKLAEGEHYDYLAILSAKA